MSRRFFEVGRSLAAAVFLVVALACGAMAQAGTQGQWSTASYQIPINPIHSALLNNGKILVVAGSGNCIPSVPGCPQGPPYGPANGSGAVLVDPVSGTMTQFTVPYDMFCNGMLVLPDGRAFINGGTVQQMPDFTGSVQSAIFDPATNLFTVVQNMAHGRWYPTVLSLGDGRVMAFSGTDENNNTNTTVEIYTEGTGWSPQYSAGWTPPLYPRMHLLPNGKVFFTGSDITTRLFDPASHTWTTVGNRIWNGTRTYGASILLPLTPANNYDPKIITMGGGQYGPTATSETIDMGASNPTWQMGPNMSQQRVELNAVLLPTQKVLVMGGSSQDEVASTASLNADLYDPVSNSFSWGGAGANTIPRLYHSMAILLPDATVWVAGSNPDYNVYEPRVEIYKPAYLFNSNGTTATRPTISSVQSTVAWGAGFTVSTPDAANISSVILMHPGAPTHAFDTDQRLVVLSFTKGSGTLTVTAPPNGNIAPPGYYMLFLVNSAGVPSVAKFIKLGSTGGNPAPTVSGISPTSGTANGGTAVTITGTGFLAGATVTLGGAAATGVTVVSSTSITATTPAHTAGAVNVVVTNADGQSGTLPNGYTYTGTNPAPTVTSISPISGISNGGMPVTITGTGFLAGATVSLGGAAATGVTVVSSTSITATTAAHTAGAVNVMVTNTDAQSGTLTNGYTYTTSTGGPATFVQVNAVTPQAATAAVVLGYSAAQAAGDLNIVVVGWNDTTSTVSSVTDTRGNAYTQAGTTVTGTGLRQALYYAKNIAAGSNTVTVAFNQAAAFVDARILEYSGLDTNNPLDVTAGAAGSSANPNSGAATTTSANELIFGAGITGGAFTAAGTGFTSRIITSPNGDIAEDQVVTSTGSNSVAAPLKSSSTWVMQMATFRASGQGGGNPAPTVSGINPTSGTANGGTPVTITGTGFLAGATVSLGGTAATGVTVASSTSITATTAAHAAGAVNVVVTNTDGQSGTLSGGYTYTGSNPAPTVSGISPTSGTANGGTAVTITGTGFLNGATVSLGGTVAIGVTVASSTSIRATTPAHTAGAVNVVVTNTDGQSGTLTGGYTYTSGGGGGGTTAFVQLNAATPQTASASVPVVFPAAQAAGDLNIVVVGWNDTTSTVSSVTDTRGNAYTQAGTTVTGTGLRQALYYAKNIAAGSNTVTVAFNQAAAFVDARILEYSGLDTNNPLDVTAGAAGSSANPNSGAATTTSANELIFGAGITGGAFTAAGTGFTSRIITSPNGDIAEDQVVTSTGSNSVAAPLKSSSTWVMQMATFRASGQGGGNPAPTVSGINPTSGTANGGTPVTITGTGFLAGATVSLGGTAATGVTVASSTSITATTAAHAAGAVNVVVTNTDGQSGTLSGGYTYTGSNPAPTVSGISPTSGTANGGTAVTITGTGFLNGATVSLGGTVATGVTVASSTSIRATTPAHTAGAVNVVVTNTDGQSGTLTNGYTYTASTGGSIAFVQLNAATPQTASASVPVAFAVAQTAGNLNIVVVGWNDTTSTVSSVTDTRGNIYTQAGTTVTGTGLRQALYYAKNIAAGSDTVTVAFNQAAAYVDVRILEYSGLDTTSPLDTTAGTAGSSASPNSGAATTTAANELIFGAGITGGAFTGAGTGFTSRIITSPNGDIAEDKVVTSTGSNSAAAPLKSSSTWVMQMATFKAAP